jgi:anti-anti-sigma factor
VSAEVSNQPWVAGNALGRERPKVMAIASPNGNGAPAVAADISHHGLTTEISLSGELDFGDRGALRRAVAEALAECRTEVLLVDMTAVTFFDSAVAHWLLEAHWQAFAAHTRVVALVADSDARDLLSLLGVAAVVTVVTAG